MQATEPIDLLLVLATDFIIVAAADGDFVFFGELGGVSIFFLFFLFCPYVLWTGGAGRVVPCASASSWLRCSCLSFFCLVSHVGWMVGWLGGGRADRRNLPEGVLSHVT